MLATDPAKAVSEVAHELMHAAHAGLIWPDEPFIQLALQSEVRDGGRLRLLATMGADSALGEKMKLKVGYLLRRRRLREVSTSRYHPSAGRYSTSPRRLSVVTNT